MSARVSRLGLVAALLSTAAGSAPTASQSGTAASDPQAFTSTVTAVLVDVVVRDKRGRPVTDLAAEDFSVEEDGVPHQIDSFTRVTRGDGIGVGVAWRPPSTTVLTTASPAAGTEAAAEPPTTAIVFDHLSSESLRLAQRAALEYIPMNGMSAARVGVFATDPGVRVVQGYTNDPALVRQAVARIVPSGTSAQEQKAERTDELVARRRSLRGESGAGAGGAGSSGGAALAATASQIGERENELRLLQTELNMIRSFDNLDRDHKGYDTSLALLAVVRSLAEYPGRKAIVFFSEGLPVTPVLSAKLDHVIDVANRANVTAYAVDASGLRTKSSLTNVRKEIDAFAEERFSQLAASTDRTEQPLAMAFERVEDTLRLDSRTGLARLAADTGGLLFEGSNDLASAFRRIDEDHRFHYLLSYSPKNSVLDGKFRTIQVKVRRTGTDVFARKGYRATAAAAGIDAAAHETAALRLLDRSPLPNTFPVHAAAFSFPEPLRPGLAALLARVGTDALRFDVDAQRATYAGHATIVARVRDADGRQVHTVSQQYVLAGQADEVSAARRGEILFYREIELPSGIYTIDTIVLDVSSQQASARVTTLNVPAREQTALSMSSLLVVGRIERSPDPAGGARGPAGPLYVDGALIYPNLGQPVSKSATPELPFYFTVYGEVGGRTLSAQLLRNGRSLLESPLDLAASNAGARVPYLGRIPLAALPVGTYELRVRARLGEDEVSRTAFFTLID